MLRFKLMVSASIRETYRQNDIYVGQVLKGARPADLPIQRPTNFEMVVNLTTARSWALKSRRAFSFAPTR